MLLGRPSRVREGDTAEVLGSGVASSSSYWGSGLWGHPHEGADMDIIWGKCDVILSSQFLPICEPQLRMAASSPIQVLQQPSCKPSPGVEQKRLL